MRLTVRGCHASLGLSITSVRHRTIADGPRLNEQEPCRMVAAGTRIASRPQHKSTTVSTTAVHNPLPRWVKSRAPASRAMSPSAGCGHWTARASVGQAVQLCLGPPSVWCGVRWSGLPRGVGRKGPAGPAWGWPGRGCGGGRRAKVWTGYIGGSRPRASPGARSRCPPPFSLPGAPDTAPIWRL